jgi:hypothetical protein
MHSDTMKYLLKLIHEECGGDKAVVDSIWSEIQSEVEEEVEVEKVVDDECFSEDGRTAVTEMTDILKYASYHIKPSTDQGTNEAYYKVSNGETYVFIENHDTVARNDFGMITTDNIQYSEDALSIINKWDGFGRSKKRKQYYFKGKNIKETLDTLTRILS